MFKNKKFYTSILIDFSFLLILYGFIYFIAQKIRGYAFLLQNFGANLSNIESVIQENISMLDYNLLLNNLEVINSVMQKVLFLFFALLAGSFLIYCIFEGYQWSFILKKKFKKYILKFSLVSLFSFLLSLFLLWNIVIKVRPLLINYFSNISIFGLVTKVVVLSILLFVLGYYTHVCYVLLANNKVIDALKKTFKFRNLKSILTSLGLFLLVIGIIVLFLMLNLIGLFWFVIMLFLILFVWNYCRYNLVRIL
jgi:hypothetical protein